MYFTCYEIIVNLALTSGILLQFVEVELICTGEQLMIILDQRCDHFPPQRVNRLV